eukprot:TRINITY_DN3405_c0_g1_i4.p2 TRINITY_DN3405_c0_g1~~TRINITY_DN3405_c0_g1_i4.p2  ORF type:complete len:63 (+),score=5.86 TRINITY_DN3405_c0_g1_i4:353-541(+)
MTRFNIRQKVVCWDWENVENLEMKENRILGGEIFSAVFQKEAYKLSRSPFNFFLQFSTDPRN